ncbi:MAG: hypothetical protein FGM27_00665 [Candidatus Omnitrophica bacterium]|nr:hypothetical protein [Candidatus Omnitrophota bacterium]
MEKILRVLFCFLFLTGCATLTGPKPGPEFNQKIMLLVPDDYQMFQAPQSTYDPGDLQSFHSQHTFPLLVQDTFRSMFAEIEILKNEPGVEMGEPDVPAVFEVRMLDLANDIYNEADTYRAHTTIAAVMKSPGGETFWQQAFRGEGWVNVDPQFSTGLGPQDAVVAAVNDALEQMRTAILKSAQVQNQLKYYDAIRRSRSETEKKI